MVLFLMDPIFFGAVVDGKNGCDSLWRMGLIGRRGAGENVLPLGVAVPGLGF